MSLRNFTLTLFILSISMGIYAQDYQYSRVKVILENKNISDLAKLGVETDHGSIKKGHYLINDYSSLEIQQIKNAGFDIEILIPNVIEHYERQLAKPHNHSHEFRGDECNIPVTLTEYPTPTNYKQGSMGGYLTYDELLSTLDSMYTLYPHLISQKAPISEIKTIENRSILYLKISNTPNIESDEPQVLYTALHHAREPNSLSQMIFYMWYLLENYDNDEEVKHIVDNTELYFIPCVNPDGYVYNHTTNPNGGGLWRKNRRLNEDSSYGVDLNRNYGYKWAEDDSGSSPNPQSQTYRGTDAFSEAETSAVKEFCENHNFKVTLNYHTHGNLLIHPWGYSDMPTDEHQTFKAIGGEMKKENDFLFGTGTETVNYTVNGDSDDWMYGERGIYSLTPEVGPSNFGFWPPSYAIDSLNKTAMYMNLAAAKVLHPFFIINDESEISQIAQIENSLVLNIENIGLQEGDIKITVSELTEVSDLTDFVSNKKLKHLDKENITIPFQISDQNATEVKFLVEKVSNFPTTYDTLVYPINLNILNQEIYTIIDDNMVNLDNWEWDNTENWGLSTTTFFSAPSSLSDSPDDDYTADLNKHITLTTPIDLTTEDYAILKFRAKWDIEDNWDYAQVLASTNKIDFVPLCGLYTNNGTNNQILDSPVYDGKQEDWVLEEIDLADFLGNEVYLRFSLITDSYQERDGIYIDDLQVELSKDNTAVKNTYSGILSLYPNPSDHLLHLVLPENLKNLKAELYVQDITGKTVITQSINTSTEDYEINIESLVPSIYFVQLKTENNIILTQKFVKQ